MSTTPKARTTLPVHHPCRSQIYRRHVSAGARFEEVGRAAVPSEYGQADDEEIQAGQLALADLSTLPKTGFKGAGAPGWLERQDKRLPNSPNFAVRQNDGSLIAQLSANELLILSDLAANSDVVATLQDRYSLDTTERVYSLPRSDSHCWFALTGKFAATALAKICGVDLRAHKFALYEVAQTSLARVNAIILRNDLDTTPCFFILSDVSSAEYLWDAFLDVMAEFNGGKVGIRALRALQAESRVS